MVVDHVKLHGAKFTRRQLLEIILFILVFGISVAAFSAFLNQIIDPQNNQFFQKLLHQQNKLIFFYLIYVAFASITIIVPTLPFDLLLLGVFNPWSVIAVRLLGGLAGSAVNFYLARTYGRPLLRRWLSAKNYNFVERIADNLTFQQFIIVTMIPIINAELMAYAGGLSHIKFRWSLLTLALAIFYRVVFIYFVMSL